MKHTSAKIGLGMYVMLWLFTVIGSLLFPLETYEYETIMADLPPSQSYLSVPDSLLDKNLKEIVNGTTYGIALFYDGTLEAWGDYPFSLEEIADMHIDHIASGARHIVLSQENEIFEFGDVPYEQTKLSERDKEFLSADGIRELYAGDTYSACLSNSGYLFYWGMSDSLTKIPAEHQSHIRKAAVHPYHIVYLLDDGTLHMTGREDRLSDIPDALQDGSISVLDFAVNYDTVLAVDEDYHVITWGDKVYEELPDERPIQQIVSGRRNFHLLYEDGFISGIGPDSRSCVYAEKLYANYFQTYAVSGEEITAWGNRGFLLGSDSYGRDILARLVHGGFATMLIGVPACLLSLLLSILFGLLSGYYGGWIDRLIIRLSECLSSIPFLPIVITLSAFLMGNTESYFRIAVIMVLYGSISWTSLARLIRAQVMIEKEKDYILYEQMIGASPMRILGRHILPVTFPMIAADITSLYASSMLIEASLSFLGFGVPPILPSWGNMLQAAQSMHVIEYCWWQWFFPALCVCLSILSVHLIAEAIRKETHSYK